MAIAHSQGGVDFVAARRCRAHGQTRRKEMRPVIQAIHRYKARFFQALAHPVRIRILELLRNGPQSVGELQNRLTVEGSNVSQQLAVLRKEHIVENTKEGTTVIYQVVDPLVFQILDVSRQMFEHQLNEMITAMQEDPARSDGKPVR